MALIMQDSTARNKTTSSLWKQKMSSSPKKQQTPEALFEVEGECIVHLYTFTKFLLRL
jgi:hypothetical protein